MSSRGLENSGGPLHVAMVKEAVKMIVDRLATMNKIFIQFEPWHKIGMSFHKDRFEKFMVTPQLDFRPDILLNQTPRDRRKATAGGFTKIRKHYDEKVWESIEDSNFIVFEIETKPKSIFRNLLKMAYYARMKDERDRKTARLTYAFVLVVPQGSSLPADTEPFDEVWKIPTEEMEAII